MTLSPTKLYAIPPSSLTDEDEECPAVVKHTMLFIKRNYMRDYDEKEFISFLKYNEVRTPISKAVKQLESFLRLYFPQTPMYKSLCPTKKVRYAPYRTRHTVEPSDDSSVLEASPSTPPPNPLRRAGSFNVEMDSAALSAIGGPSMSLVVNIFPNGTATATQAQVSPPVEEVTVKVVLPDDFKTQLRIFAQATVTDLRFELRKLLLARYPAKRPEDVPLDKLILKTKMGWILNLADRVRDAVLEDTVVYCYYLD